MGLDIVEFVISVEDAFGIAIPNQVAQNLVTPRAVADYVQSRLAAGNDEVCHSQRAFYMLRAAAVQSLEVPRGRVTPNSKWRALLPGGAFSKKWKRLGKVVGVSDWPASSIPGYTPPPSRTVGATAEYLAQRFPALVKGHGSAWSRREIETVLAGLIQHVLGIASFGWDDRFVEDLRLD